MRHQMQAIATAWLASTQFPPYSVPLDTHNTAYVAPRKGQALTLPLADGSTVNWRVDKYIFVAPEAVTGHIEVSGGRVDGLPEVQLSAGSARFSASVEGAGQGRFRFVWQPSPDGIKAVAGEIVVHVHMTLQGKPFDFESRIQYQDPVAFVRAVGEPKVEAVNWVIPAYVEARRPGRYVLRANLLTEQGVPVAHLFSQQDLQGGRAEMLLRAHISVLKLAGETPAYILEGWQIYRKPLPGEKTLWGSSEMGRVRVRAFPLTDYIDEGWRDPKAAERQAFFERMAGGLSQDP